MQDLRNQAKPSKSTKETVGSLANPTIPSPIASFRDHSKTTQLLLITDGLLNVINSGLPG